MWEESQSETRPEHNTHTPSRPHGDKPTLIDTRLNLAAGLPVVAGGKRSDRHLTARQVTISRQMMQSAFFLNQRVRVRQ